MHVSGLWGVVCGGRLQEIVEQLGSTCLIMLECERLQMNGGAHYTCDVSG